MSRTADERAAEVRRWLEAARSLRGERALQAELVRTTGLSSQGVRLAFAEHLEVDARDDEIARLVAAAGDTSRVTVILSANVFIAGLRAIVLARAAAPHVEVRASSRAPSFARALVTCVSDPATTFVVGRNVEDLGGVTEGEIHVYGRDETIAAVRSIARVPVRGHGTGFGVAIVTGDLKSAARGLAADVVPFDQRGCLSPRIAFVRGDRARALEFGESLADALAALGEKVPRGELSDEERADAVRYRETIAYAGSVLEGESFLIGVGDVATLPPSGRHVHVVPFASQTALDEALAPFARHVAAIGSNGVEGDLPRTVPYARRSALGRMQKPPLDGPVDLRESAAARDEQHFVIRS